MEKIPELLLRLLGNCAATETALFHSRKTDEDFLSRWHPDVIVYQLEDETGETFARRMLAHPRHSVASVPAFSFASDVDAGLSELSARMGFMAHLESPVLTSRELELHLTYGLRLARAVSPVAGTPSKSFDKAFEAVTSFHSSLDKTKVVESAMLHMPLLIPADGWALYLSTETGQQLELVAAVNTAGRGMVKSIYVTDETNPLVKVIREGKAQLVSGPDVRLYLPLLTQGNLFGGIIATLPAGQESLSEEERELAERVSASLAIALGNATSYTQAENLCQLDDLTHLYNARFFYQALETELKRSRRHNLHLAVIFMDLDGFKSVNDEYGHLAGSGTLVEIGLLLHGLVRETDVVSRYGGDEFIIALPETTAGQACIIAERIRLRIETHAFQRSRGFDVHLTCSLGISAYPEHGTTSEELVREADLAMYDGKQAQKNRVVVSKLSTHTRSLVNSG